MLDAEPVPPPAARRRAETRREILAAAWDLCREHGLAGLSLRELASRVGMRAPSLYSYFGSKDDIYDAMFAQGQQALLAAEPADPAPARSRAWMKTEAEAFFSFCVADPVRYQLMFQRVVPGFVPSAGSYALAVRVLDSHEARMAQVGITDRGLLDLWTAMISGLTSQQIANDPGGDRWARLLDDAVELFCDRAGVPPDHSPARTGPS